MWSNTGRVALVTLLSHSYIYLLLGKHVVKAKWLKFMSTGGILECLEDLAQYYIHSNRFETTAKQKKGKTKKKSPGRT